MWKSCEFEFKTCINTVTFLPVFVYLVFSAVQWRLRHTGSSGLARVFDYDLFWKCYSRGDLPVLSTAQDVMHIHSLKRSG